jgi:hypothetical protein
MLARFFALADGKLGASFQLPSMSEGLQNSVERKLIVNGCGKAASKIQLVFAALTSTGLKVANDNTCS